MDRETRFARDFQTLRLLCDEAASREERQELLQSLAPPAFADPEHQVVLESVRALFPRGPISVTALRIHLNNRGFPDTDVEKYFRRPNAGPALSAGTDKPTP